HERSGTAPATAPAVHPRSSERPRPIVLPPRRRRPSAMLPNDERSRRRLRDQTKGAMVDAVYAVTEGVEDPPFELSREQTEWLRGLVAKRCRAHLGPDAQICPGESGACSGSARDPLTTCYHACPGPPACHGSLGRMIACEYARVVFEL